MPGKLYKVNLSPPARAAMMACEIFNFPVEMIDVKLFEGEHRTPEFLKMNPVHSVPVLVDGDLTIHDSHAILMYLADAYGNNDLLYPKDLKKRTLVNQMLFFDSAILFQRLRNVSYPVLVEGAKGPFDKQFKDMEEAYGMLEEFLSRTKFIAVDEMTIADIAALPTVQALDCLWPINISKYPKILAWIKNMEKQPFCQKYNASGAAEARKLLKEKLSS